LLLLLHPAQTPTALHCKSHTAEALDNFGAVLSMV